MRIFSFGLLALLIAGGASAQVVTPADATFRSGVDLVALNVTVTDDRFGVVTDLEASDFAVLEDGVPKDISVFWQGQAPLDVAILLDASTSMAWQFAAMRSAALAFVYSLRPGDRAAVIAVRWDTRVVQPLSTDLAGAVHALNEMRPFGATALYDGIALAFAELASADSVGSQPVRRRAIVVLSDGEDTASLTGFEEVLQRAREAMVTVYTISLPQPVPPRPKRRQPFAQTGEITALAEITGGVSFFPESFKELNSVYGLVAHDLASQYVLGYASSPPDAAAWRTITVSVRDRPGLRTRTRSGYAPR